MTFEIVQGDLFDPAFEFDALAQGVNCKGLMGAGIAVRFREESPAMYKEYKDLCDRWGDDIAGMFHFYRRFDKPSVYNLFTQIWYGKNGDYALVNRSAMLMRFHAESLDNMGRIGLPWIGCGIAGLEKHNVKAIYENVLGDSLVEFTLVEQ